MPFLLETCVDAYAYRGSFSSTEVLNQRILAFIEFFNEMPFRWTYIGKPLLA
jgi:hypothetical protein